MKIKILLFGILIYASTKLNAQEEKMIKTEAMHHCACFKSFNKEIEKIERKAIRKEKRDSKPKRYEPGTKIFGGQSLTLSLEDCLNQKRSMKTIKFIKSLNDKEKEKFREKVKLRVKKKCPKYNSKEY